MLHVHILTNDANYIRAALVVTLVVLFPLTSSIWPTLLPQCAVYHVRKHRRSSRALTFYWYCIVQFESFSCSSPIHFKRLRSIVKDKKVTQYGFEPYCISNVVILLMICFVLSCDHPKSSSAMSSKPTVEIIWKLCCLCQCDKPGEVLNTPEITLERSWKATQATSHSIVQKKLR
jgi:hypothetical protein